MKLKGLHLADVAEIQEAVTDELKKVQKEEFSVVFQKLYDRAKASINANGAYFELNVYIRDALLDIYLVRPKSVFTSCINVQGISDQCRLLMEVEWQENCREH